MCPPQITWTMRRTREGERRAIHTGHELSAEIPSMAQSSRQKLHPVAFHIPGHPKGHGGGPPFTTDSIQGR